MYTRIEEWVDLARTKTELLQFCDEVYEVVAPQETGKTLSGEAPFGEKAHCLRFFPHGEDPKFPPVPAKFRQLAPKFAKLPQGLRVCPAKCPEDKQPFSKGP